MGLLLLVDIAIVVVVGRAFGNGLARIGQPPVLGEIFVGIALGPSLLGAVAPDVSATLFPDETLDRLAAVGGVGLSVFMFLIGVEFDLAAARRRRRAVAWISSGALIAPFALGVLIAIPLYAAHPPPEDSISPAVFALFIGTALSLTAFPVLLRIVSDRGIAGTAIALLATSSAAILDLAGWMLLTFSVFLMGSDGFGRLAAGVAGLVAAVCLLMAVCRPVLGWAMGRVRGGRRQAAPWILLILAVLIASVELVELAGFHGILGAFLLGLICPRDTFAVSLLRRTLWPVTVTVLLPVYFVGPGFGVDIGGIGATGLPTLALIVVVACASKWGGAVLGARRVGLPWREAHAVGVLLNTRGIVELIVLVIGFEAGVLDQVLYSQLVLMAIATTLMAGPVLGLLGVASARPAGVDLRTTPRPTPPAIP